ncbi:MAG TPA: Ig-like domain-containing protein [Steroidobacteraceae bacterium]|nr:Ig-like domain-containing protein [Steroidobacteraceae bacterium]
MRKILGSTLACIAALLSACGSDNTLVAGPTPPVDAPAQTITLQTSRTTIPSDGSELATITATVRGTQNQALPDVVINFTSSSGSISSNVATTNANGIASVTLSADSDPTNRTITVTASNGAVTRTVTVDVTGSILTFSNPPSSLVQSGAAAPFVVILADDGNNGIANVPVTLSSSLGATITPGVTQTTDGNGRATFNVAATGSGVSTLTATALGLTAIALVTYSNDVFTITTPTQNQNVPIFPAAGSTISVTANWSIGGVPQLGDIAFASTRGAVSSPTATLAGGVATVTLSSTSAGQATIQATTPTGVIATRTINFVSTVPGNVVLQADPANVPIGEDSTLTAIVRDASGNLVQGVAVNFSVLQDITGGVLSQPTANTNAQGRATTIYTAGSSTSPSDGVIIQASIPSAALTTQVALTVGGRNVFISLGTGNTINAPNQTQYRIEYSAQAIDSAGVALVNIPISFTIHALEYLKGDLAWGGRVWGYNLPAPVSCLNEDLDLDGVLDLLPATEDTNGNGRLTPGDVATVFPRTVNTDATGTSVVTITYPKNHAKWIRARLVATAVVQGSERSNFADFMLPGLAADYSQEAVSPPGEESPFGIVRDCLAPF